MKRVTIGVLASLLLSGLLVYGVEAQRGRGRHGRQQARPQQAPHSDQIAGALGEIEWGMSKNQVLNHFFKKIRDTYNPRIAKARDAMQEDQLRHEMANKMRIIRESYIEFRGQTTGWDVSFLREEFTHNNGEAMIVVRDRSAQNFFFFIRGRLWKWYRAFNASVFGGHSFDQFAQALQGRYGEARERNDAIFEGGPNKHWLEWQDNTTRLRAVDENRFYGFYCLVFEEKATLSNLANLRTTPDRRGHQNRHALVEAVTSGEGEAANPDQNPDIVDRITGNIRHRQDAPEQGGSGSPTSMTSTSSSSSSSTSMSSGNATMERGPGVNDDPLRGLDEF